MRAELFYWDGLNYEYLFYITVNTSDSWTERMSWTNRFWSVDPWLERVILQRLTGKYFHILSRNFLDEDYGIRFSHWMVRYIFHQIFNFRLDEKRKVWRASRPKIEVEFKGEKKRFAAEEISSIILTKVNFPEFSELIQSRIFSSPSPRFLNFSGHSPVLGPEAKRFSSLDTCYTYTIGPIVRSDFHKKLL